MNWISIKKDNGPLLLDSPIKELKTVPLLKNVIH